MITTFIYTLSDSTGIRYVGKSDNPEKRLVDHIKDCKKKRTKKEKWISSLISKGKYPLLEILDEVPYEDWGFFEAYWISQLRSWGLSLLNGTDGGEGSNGFLGRTHSKYTKSILSQLGRLKVNKQTSQPGEKNGRSKLTWEKVRSIREEYKNGSRLVDLSKSYNITDSQISKIVKNKSWAEN